MSQVVNCSIYELTKNESSSKLRIANTTFVEYNPNIMRMIFIHSRYNNHSIQWIFCIIVIIVGIVKICSRI
jgi:hypothetical protein